jgi:drug/metabolite transporter superfamily protein YnfA
MGAPKGSDEPGILAEYWAFLREHKKWWMVPVALLLLVLGALLLVTQGSPLAPLIYSIF